MRLLSRMGKLPGQTEKLRSVGQLLVRRLERAMMVLQQESCTSCVLLLLVIAGRMSNKYCRYPLTSLYLCSSLLMQTDSITHGHSTVSTLQSAEYVS